MRTHGMQLTRRDLEILDMLSLRVRVASLDQITRTWWGRSTWARKLARHRLGCLEERDLITRFAATTIFLPPLVGPLVTWEPGGPFPDFGHIAWFLRQRWSGHCRAATICLATRKGALIYGARRFGRLSHPFQLSHDLGVTEMFLTFRSLFPTEATRWIDEQRLSPHRRRQKLPDAVIADRPGATPRLVLEFGGAYGKRRLAAFHDDAQSRGVPYQIW